MKCFIAAPGMNPLAKAQPWSSSVLMIPPSSLETALQPLPSLATGEAGVGRAGDWLRPQACANKYIETLSPVGDAQCGHETPALALPGRLRWGRAKGQSQVGARRKRVMKEQVAGGGNRGPAAFLLPLSWRA